MKPCSFYNTLFCSEKFGFYLYNALTGVMIELDKAHYEITAGIRDGQGNSLPGEIDSGFVAFLEEQGFLAAREDEQLTLVQMQYKRNTACFSTSTAGLTICPTLFCNFCCPYCFESGRNEPVIMGRETMDALITFIQNHRDVNRLAVIWFGGEPSLVLDVIKKLTSRFLELFPGYDNAALLTNGYLLDENWIAELAELQITRIQIPLDGREKVHDSRKMLKGDGPTYRQIIENIDLLMSSSWKGKLSLRVNIDRTKSDEFALLWQELLHRYDGKNIAIYPARIESFPDQPYGQQCSLCATEWSDFILESYKNDGIVPPGGFFPMSEAMNVCIATARYGYVIGPRVEIYKCFEDVGNESMVIGSLKPFSQE